MYQLWWIAKWMCTLGCVFLLAVTAMTLHWKYVNVTDHDILLVGAGQGSFGIVWGDVTPYNRYRDNVVEFGDVFKSWAELRDAWVQDTVWWPRTDQYPGGTSMLMVPLWMPFALFALPTIWLWWRPPKQISEECCKQCGYDLTENVSGKCPECGAVTNLTEPEDGE